MKWKRSKKAAQDSKHNSKSSSSSVSTTNTSLNQDESNSDGKLSEDEDGGDGKGEGADDDGDEEDDNEGDDDERGANNSDSDSIDDSALVGPSIHPKRIINNKLSKQSSSPASALSNYSTLLNLSNFGLNNTGNDNSLRPKSFSSSPSSSSNIHLNPSSLINSGLSFYKSLRPNNSIPMLTDFTSASIRWNNLECNNHHHSRTVLDGNSNVIAGNETSLLNTTSHSISSSLLKATTTSAAPINENPHPNHLPTNHHHHHLHHHPSTLNSATIGSFYRDFVR